jgi:hypothetical protein
MLWHPRVAGSPARVLAARGLDSEVNSEDFYGCLKIGMTPDDGKKAWFGWTDSFLDRK